jgi:hypothetical protein
VLESLDLIEFVADHPTSFFCFCSSIRGGYAPVRDAIGAGGKDASFALKFLAGAITGGVGSIIGNPFEYVNVV